MHKRKSTQKYLRNRFVCYIPFKNMQIFWQNRHLSKNFMQLLQNKRFLKSFVKIKDVVMCNPFIDRGIENPTIIDLTILIDLPSFNNEIPITFQNINNNKLHELSHQPPSLKKKNNINHFMNIKVYTKKKTFSFVFSIMKCLLFSAWEAS